ncbi:hypothetical protein L227DRAFT_48575 [Lentinus tigrinus ALCF2SS1-6]|uniref:Uncharacterized protein n=1 Tax=Lentinus tigrinus ALCF2SS1-6 TaxID=1328759 RepID=A0A5C2SE57_9APHY|nr:hypothetical protein L227DRAFT_48575 [Lentinus tigrinus ALCF2SS1-6]
MPKPTLLQSILGRPSQSYNHPPERDYHSTRHEIFKIAHRTRVIPGQFEDSGFDSSTPGNSDSEAHLSSATLDRVPQRPSSQVRKANGVDADSAQGRRTSTVSNPPTFRHHAHPAACYFSPSDRGGLSVSRDE